MAKRKEVKLADILGGLTKEQLQAFAEQYNGGLGSGLTPEEYRAKYHSGDSDSDEKTGKDE